MTLRRALLPTLLLSAAGCRSFGPPTAATIAALQPLPLAAQLQHDYAGDGLVLQLELETPVLTGVFDVVGRRPATGQLRLQLFPDVGGKVLDMGVGDRWRSVVATMADDEYAARAPLDAAAPHLALLLAALFGELLQPVEPSRVLGERADADGPVLRLAPAVGSGDCEVTIGPDGAISAYRIRLGVFRIELLADGTFAGPRVRGRISR